MQSRLAIAYGAATVRAVLVAPGGATTLRLDGTADMSTAAHVSTRDVLPGAALATACWVLLQAVGGAYVTGVLKGSSQTYGGFAAVVGLLAWLLIAAEVTLVAAEVNVVLARKLWPRSIGGRLTAADERSLRDAVLAAQRDARQEITVTFAAPVGPSPISSSRDDATAAP